MCAIHKTYSKINSTYVFRSDGKSFKFTKKVRSLKMELGHFYGA